MSIKTSPDKANGKLLFLIKKGQSNAITSQELAAKLNTHERFIRLEIRRLIASGIPIASSNSKPMGFFIVETLEEAQHYMASLRSRLVEDAYRRRDFQRAVKELWPTGQLKLL